MKKFIGVTASLALCACMLISCLVFLCACEPMYKFKNIRYGEHERQRLNICLPKDRSGDVGLILVIHGGAWVAGDKNDCTNSIEAWCKRYGCVTAAINYHYISEEFSCDDIMQDIALSLDKIKEFAAERGINIERAMLVGASAGGHLSMLYAYKCADMAQIKPVAVANYSGPTDLTDENYFNGEGVLDYLDIFSKLCGVKFTEENRGDEDVRKRMLEYSPVNYVSENTVPTLICHGDADNVVPYSNATTLKNTLDRFGIGSDLLTYRNSGHGLDGDEERSRNADTLFGEYVKTYLERVE